MAIAPTLYGRVGGDAFFEALTTHFYHAIGDEPLLARLYPTDADAFETARVHFRDFLIQFFGGPATYSERRGPPQLRTRHLPFTIGVAERDAWVRLITDAVRASGIRGMDESRMMTYFQSAATQMINQPEGSDQRS